MNPVTMLKCSDWKLAQVIRYVTPNDQLLSSERYGSDYEALVRAIISQQISTSAARAITHRLVNRVEDLGITPTSLIRLSKEDLRVIGLSGAKANYIFALGHSLLNGDLDLSILYKMPDEEAVLALQQIRGVGRWTAQMFAITQMARENIFPVKDGGIRSAMTKLYNLSPKPPDSELSQIAENWIPYRTLACLFLWKALNERYFQ